MIKNKNLLDDHVCLFSANEHGLLMHNVGTYVLYLEEEKLKNLLITIQQTLEYYKEFDVTDQDILDTNTKIMDDVHKELHRQSIESGKRKQKAKKMTNIYLAQNTETKNLKIGYSKNPKNRIQQLNLSSDVKIELLYYFEDYVTKERELHDKYGFLNLNSEWFEYDQQIINEFKFRQDEI